MKYEKEWSFALFTAGEGGYNTFRIPAVITLPGGRILAFAEGRRMSAHDYGEIDLVVKISDDGGRTFGPLKLVASGGGNTAGNPCPVYDRVTGKVIMVFNRNLAEGHQRLIEQGKAPRTVHVTVSNDNGDTWEPERDITEQTKLPDWTWYGVGPNHALQLASGRILIPCNHAVLIEGEEKSGPYHSHTIYSDDHGETWTIGEDIDVYTTEDVVVQLKDGRVLINIRLLDYANPGIGCRFMAVSTDDGVSFGEYRYVKEQPDPGCQGSMLAVIRDDKEYVLVTNAATTEGRKRMMIHESADGGDTWAEACLLTDDPAAYSDLTETAEGKIGVLYETGKEWPYETITWTVVKIS